jgi:hypothetical protein
MMADECTGHLPAADLERWAKVVVCSNIQNEMAYAAHE